MQHHGVVRDGCSVLRASDQPQRTMMRCQSLLPPHDEAPANGARPRPPVRLTSPKPSHLTCSPPTTILLTLCLLLPLPELLCGLAPRPQDNGVALCLCSHTLRPSIIMSSNPFRRSQLPPAPSSPPQLRTDSFLPAQLDDTGNYCQCPSLIFWKTDIP